MNTNKLTQRSMEVISNAQTLAQERGNQQIKQVHLLTALLTQENSLIARLLGNIGVDVTAVEKDCQALLEAGWCGVRLLATAHAASRADLASRQVYRPLWETKLFETAIILRSDKSWRTERMTI